MTTERLLFWLAVFGNLILLYYTIRIAFRATMGFRKGSRLGALWNVSAASALVGLTALFPWTLVAGEREIGKVALLICLLTPFVVFGVKLWARIAERTLIPRTMPKTVSQNGQQQRIEDPFGWHRNDSGDSLWTFGWTRGHK